MFLHKIALLIFSTFGLTVFYTYYINNAPSIEKDKGKNETNITGNEDQNKEHIIDNEDLIKEPIPKYEYFVDIQPYSNETFKFINELRYSENIKPLEWDEEVYEAIKKQTHNEVIGSKNYNLRLSTMMNKDNIGTALNLYTTISNDTIMNNDKIASHLVHSWQSIKANKNILLNTEITHGAVCVMRKDDSTFYVTFGAVSYKTNTIL